MSKRKKVCEDCYRRGIRKCPHYSAHGGKGIVGFHVFTKENSQGLATGFKRVAERRTVQEEVRERKKEFILRAREKGKEIKKRKGMTVIAKYNKVIEKLLNIQEDN